jgi:mono/diheme cytochrome c family protein
MNRFLRAVGLGVLVLVLVVVVAISLTVGWRPFLGPRARAVIDRKFQATPERLARGRYLSNYVTGCIDCHSDHDWKAPGAPVLEAKLGAGQVFPGMFPGSVVAPNITPDAATGAGIWTDDQLARAIREGIGHDGRTLFPLMPYEKFRSLSDEDLASIVVYLRSLPPIHNPLPKTEIIFPVKYLMRSAPEPLTTPVLPPDVSTPQKRGAYLVQIADCIDCHTPQQKGQYNMALAFAGGFQFSGTPLPDVTSANITPDASGIDYYDENLFLEVMHTGKVKARELSAMMPWIDYGQMTEEDLKAVFAYLRTLKPVHHQVDNSLPPTYCKLCRGKHGAGDRN